MQKRCAAWLSAVGLVLLMTGCSAEPDRTPESFCSTYQAEKNAYIAKYDRRSQQIKSLNNPLATVFGGFATSFQALGDVVSIFDKLSKVAPDDIQAAVEGVRDSLKKTEDQLGSENPLSGGSILTTLLAGFENSLESSGAWEQVGNYVKNTCHSN